MRVTASERLSEPPYWPPYGAPALRRLVEVWRGEGCPPQTAISWPRQQWLDRFAGHAVALTRLPDGLDRAAVALACENADASPEVAEEAFLAVMAWGYGRTGYGPYRVGRVLSQNRRAGERLREVAATLWSDGAVAAYRRLASYNDCRLRFLGPAFGTKFLALCSTDASRPALILDGLVSAWLERNVGQHFDPVPWDASVYQRYLQQMYEWADALDVRPDDLEFLVFLAEAGARRSSQWGTDSLAAKLAATAFPLVPPERDRVWPPGSPEPTCWWLATGKLDGRWVRLRWRNGRWSGDPDLLTALLVYLRTFGLSDGTRSLTFSPGMVHVSGLLPSDIITESGWQSEWPFAKAEEFARLLLSDVTIDQDWPWVDDGRIE
jgi:hypothetical protein